MVFIPGVPRCRYRLDLCGRSIRDIQPGTRILQWILETIDPRTGAEPDEVEAGFLPPNDFTGRGEGHVSFTVQPRAGLPTGTVIANDATIYFDTNSGIATNTWVNTIDVGAPSSHVTSLPALALSPSFEVSWYGQDDPSGSGIAGFTIMVSDNDGPFYSWLTLSGATTATFTGLQGHTYKFFSVATDNVGNVELKTPGPEAITKVSEIWHLPPTQASHRFWNAPATIAHRPCSTDRLARSGWQRPNLYMDCTRGSLR